MLIISGFLVSQGYLNHIPLVIVTLLGSLTGFLTGYLIGVKIGKPFLERYGKFIHLTPERLEQTEKWFSKYGTAAILIAYFIPGVRHIVPYLSGIAKMHFRKVLLYAFTGAILWILTFSSIGRFFGNKWSMLDNIIGDYIFEILGIAAIIGVIVFLIRKNYKHNKKGDHLNEG